MKEVSIEVTHACDMKCIMCSSKAWCPSPIENELTTVEIKDTLKNSRMVLNPRHFSVSGGEPLIRKDIWKILEYAYKLGYKILLYTTGVTKNKDEFETISYEDLLRLKEMDVAMIYDFQSCNRGRFNKIFGFDYGNPDVFDLITTSIEEAITMGVDVETHFVPQKDNFGDIIDTVYFLENLGVKKVSFLRLVKQGRASENDIELSKKQFIEMQYVFRRLLADKGLRTEIRLGHPIDWMFLIDKDAPITACRGGIDAPLIQPDGTVDVCPAWKDLKRFSAGSIREKPLEEIWNESDVYKIFRNFIHGFNYRFLEGKCSDCPYLYACKGGCVAQRLIHNIKLGIPLHKAISKGSDPMCFYEER